MNLKRRKGYFNVLLAVVLVLFVSAFFSACGNNKSDSGKITLEFLGPSPVAQPNGFQQVLDEVYRRTDGNLDIRINYVFTGFDTIGQQISLRIAAGEQLDGAFVAQWTNPTMMQMISQGLLHNLDSYFNNDKYPGLKKYFQSDFLAANSFPDSSGVNHIFAIPFADGFGMGTEGIFYRKDLADKYGIGEINSYDKLIQYMEAIKRNEPGMQPFASKGMGIDFYLMNIMYRSAVQTSQHNTDIFDGTLFSAAIGDDGRAYVARHFVPQMDPRYLSMIKGPFASEDPLLYPRLSRSWYENGYIGSDPLQDNDPTAMFMAGRLAATHQNSIVYNTIENQLKNSLPNAKLGVWVCSPTARFNTKKAEGCGFNAWNFLAVPTTSKNLDKIMQFMDWIYSDRSNYDLLTYGIEGTHWIPVGNEKLDQPANFNPANTYDFPYYILTMNPLLTRYPVATPDSVLRAWINSADADYFYKRPTTGFSIVTSSIETEMAKLNDLLAYKAGINAGLYPNVEAEVARIQAMFDDAGFRIVAAEIERQFNEYLRTHPYEGQ
jgi:putative aldouronate transport system substrate-binding protein